MHIALTHPWLHQRLLLLKDEEEGGAKGAEDGGAEEKSEWDFRVQRGDFDLSVFGFKFLYKYYVSC